MTSSPTSPTSALAVLVEGPHVAAQRARLQLALVDGQERHAADERRADVGAAARREQPRAGTELVVDPAKALRRQRRAGRADAAQRAQVAGPAAAGLHAGLHAARDERRARAQARDLSLRREVPEAIERRRAGAAVVEHDRGRREQHADEEVPHHPAGRREPERAVVLVHVEVQVQVLELLEQDPAVALDDRLRQAGRAARVQDPERVVERHRHELERRVVRPEEAVLPAAGVEVAEPHERPADLRMDLLHHLRAVEVTPAVAVAVDREQHRRLDLREAVDHRARAEVRRAARPDGAEAGGREERRDRLGDVRHVRGDAVAAADAERAQPGLDARGQRAQLRPRHRLQRAQLGGVADRDRVAVAPAEDVLGIGERRPGEPLRARHRAAARAPPAAARGSARRSTRRSTTRSPRGRRSTRSTGRRTSRPRRRGRPTASRRRRAAACAARTPRRAPTAAAACGGSRRKPMTLPQPGGPRSLERGLELDGDLVLDLQGAHHRRELLDPELALAERDAAADRAAVDASAGR